MNPNDLPGFDAWLTNVPEEEAEREEEDSREGEDNAPICGQFYDGL